MIKVFSEAAWEDYLYLQTQDKKTLQRINQLIKDIERGPFEGLGKPEPLRNNLSGLWSRRIDSKNHLIYEISGENLKIYSCKDHYA